MKKTIIKATTEQKYFREWCESNPDITRGKSGDLFGIDLRTVHRYLSCKTQPHGGVIRLMEAFKKFPEVQAYMIKRHIT